MSVKVISISYMLGYLQ